MGGKFQSLWRVDPNFSQCQSERQRNRPINGWTLSLEVEVNQTTTYSSVSDASVLFASRSPDLNSFFFFRRGNECEKEKPLCQALASNYIVRAFVLTDVVVLAGLVDVVLMVGLLDGLVVVFEVTGLLVVVVVLAVDFVVVSAVVVGFLVVVAMVWVYEPPVSCIKDRENNILNLCKAANGIQRERVKQQLTTAIAARQTTTRMKIFIFYLWGGELWGGGMNPTLKWVVFYTTAAFFYMDNLSGAGFSIDSSDPGQLVHCRQPFWAIKIVTRGRMSPIGQKIFPSTQILATNCNNICLTTGRVCTQLKGLLFSPVEQTESHMFR